MLVAFVVVASFTAFGLLHVVHLLDSHRLPQPRFGALASASADEADPPAARQRLVAVGDLHGDYRNGLASLQLTGAVDGEGHWQGGASVLIQTGDIMDRGPHSLKLLQLMDTLKREAAAAGGRVVTLLGNHEVMNIEGNNDYVSRTELEEYGERRWLEDFSSHGVFGRRLARLPAAVMAGEGLCSTLFVHAGIMPEHIRSGLAALNKDVVDCNIGNRSASRLSCSRLLGESGLSQTAPGSGIGQGDQDGGEDIAGSGPMIACILAEYTAACIIYRLCHSSTYMAPWSTGPQVGHTPQKEGIRTRCGGALAIIDAGICERYFNRSAAWECRPASGEAFALSSRGQQLLPRLWGRRHKAAQDGGDG
eukprot:SM000131S26716  [mRNA]  locus=s131:132159:135145:- [translate_table: standard]